MKSKYKQISQIVAGLLFLCFVQSVSAQGLLGKRYAGIQIAQANPGEEFVEEIDNSILQLCGGINLPVNTNTDAQIILSYAKLDGDYHDIDVDAAFKGAICGISYHFTPEQRANPFIGVRAGLVIIDAKASVEGYNKSEDETNFAFSLATGVEIDLSKEAAIRPTVEYLSIDNEDDFITGISANYWFNDSIFSGLGTSYAFDHGDISYSASIGFNF